jgi:hypothetical protein
MVIPLQITLRDVPCPDAVIGQVRRQLAAIERTRVTLACCRVTLQGPAAGGDGDYLAHVTVQEHKGAEMIGEACHGRDASEAIGAAFDAMIHALTYSAARRKPRPVAPQAQRVPARA